MGASKIFSKEFKGFLELCIVFLVSGINCYKNLLLHGSYPGKRVLARYK